VLTPPSGFGVGFGEAFGGLVTVVDAVITNASPGTATLMELPRSPNSNSSERTPVAADFTIKAMTACRASRRR
jgi:hypothetical protein